MAVKALLHGWPSYLALSWLTSRGIFYIGITLDSDPQRWLPVISRAEDYVSAHWQ